MRISKNEIKAIKESVNSLDKGAEIYLFGSRNVDLAKGGDIDLLIISEKLSYDDTITIRKNLYEKLEEQKIHIIIAQDTTDPFVKIAYREGGVIVNNDLLELLSKELKLLEDSTEILKYSYGNCQKIGIQKDFVIEDMDQFEAFTSRFARMSDMLIQKVFRLLDKIELDDEGTIRDRINRAEKK